MAPRTSNNLKEELAKKAEATAGENKLKKSMSIADLIKAMLPEIKKALPEVITPERFTRMALSALNTTPKLQECTQMSFLAALMNAAQLGLEPNTPLGQAYLIPFNNKGTMECQFQIGYTVGDSTESQRLCHIRINLPVDFFSVRQRGKAEVQQVIIACPRPDEGQRLDGNDI